MDLTQILLQIYFYDFHLFRPNLSLYFWFKVYFKHGFWQTSLNTRRWKPLVLGLNGLVLFFPRCECVFSVITLCGSVVLLISCLFFSRCRWWTGKDQGANFLWVSIEVEPSNLQRNSASVHRATIFFEHLCALTFDSEAKGLKLNYNELYLSWQSDQQWPSVSGPVGPKPGCRTHLLRVVISR